MAFPGRQRSRLGEVPIGKTFRLFPAHRGRSCRAESGALQRMAMSAVYVGPFLTSLSNNLPQRQEASGVQLRLPMSL